MDNIDNVSSFGDGRFKWTIEDFDSIIQGDDCNIVSPCFIFANQLWYLEFAKIKKNHEYWIELSCKNVASEMHYPKLHVKLGMKTGYKGKLETHSGETNEHGFFNVHMWMPWLEMLEERDEILYNGCLIVFCELRSPDIGENVCMLKEPLLSEEASVKENEVTDSEFFDERILESKTVEKTREDFANLFISREDSDVTIKVQGEEFSAHRDIMQARCVMFKSIFSYEMIEKGSGVVVMDDCDPVTFPDFLKYVYTGSTKHICDKNVFSLYTISHNYCIDELKEVCVLFMKNCLSVNTFCDVITIALRHDVKELIRLAYDFFRDNALEIVKMPKWEIFLHENLKAGNELFIKAFSTEKGILVREI